MPTVKKIIRSPSITVKGVVIDVEVMSAQDWHNVPRNSIQRNEELRNALHLKELRPEHGVVAMARDFFGNIVKIDGHTRDYIVDRNPSDLKEFLVIVYNLPKSMSLKLESERLYNSYDSRRSVKTSPETIQGYLNGAGIELKTDWMAKGEFSEAMTLAASYVKGSPSRKEKRDQIEFFREEILILDEMGLDRKRFKVPFLAAAILMLRRDKGQTTKDMIKGYSDMTGIVFVNGMGNALWYLDQYAQCGVTGDESKRSTWNGKFGTGNGHAQQAIHKIVTYMLKAVEKGSKTLCKRPYPADMDLFKKSL